jgi:hypothetical protein
VIVSLVRFLATGRAVLDAATFLAMFLAVLGALRADSALLLNGDDLLCRLATGHVGLAVTVVSGTYYRGGSLRNLQVGRLTCFLAVECVFAEVTTDAAVQ